MFIWCLSPMEIKRNEGVENKAEILETQQREKAKERRPCCRTKQKRETVHSMGRFIGMLWSSEALPISSNTTIMCQTRMTLLS